MLQDVALEFCERLARPIEERSLINIEEIAYKYIKRELVRDTSLKGSGTRSLFYLQGAFEGHQKMVFASDGVEVGVVSMLTI